jgi:hypothetical protein
MVFFRTGIDFFCHGRQYEKGIGQQIFTFSGKNAEILIRMNINNLSVGKHHALFQY